MLGLILNELIANSLRHAYPQQKEGTVNVVLKEDGGFITLAVSDDGCGMPPGYDEAVSTGLPLVRMLARQAGGTFELHGETGTAAVVSFKR